MSIGLSGGYPGCNAASVLMRDTKDADLREGFPSTEDGLSHSEVAQWGEFTIGADDVFYQHYMGGGGYGDPLARDPEAVVDDVALRVVSSAVAEAVYGVGLDPAGASDQDLTDRLRSEIRSARAGRELATDLCRRRDVPLTGRRINEYLQRTDDGVQCTWCGHLLGDGSRPWKLDAQLREVLPTAGGPMRTSVDGLLLRQFICPSCATQLDNEIAFATDELLLDEIRAWPKEAAAAADPDSAA